MRPLALSLALLCTATAAPYPQPVSVKPAWTVPGTHLLGFTDSGDAVTRSYPAPSLSVLDVQTGKSKRTIAFPEAANDMGQLAFTPDLRSFAWLDSRHEKLTFRTPQGVKEASLPGLRGTLGLKFSPDGGTLAVWNVLGYVQLWDVASGQRRHSLMLTGQPANVTFHPTQPVLAVAQRSGAGGFVTFWQTETGMNLLTLSDVQSVPRTFSFLSNGRMLMDGRLLDFDLNPESGVGYARTPESLAKYVEPCPPDVLWKACLRGFRSGSLSADGKTIAMNIARTPQNTPSLLIYDQVGNLHKIVDTPGFWAQLTPDGKHLILKDNGGNLSGAALP